MNNIYNNEAEKEDDWGWFIRLDLDNTTPTTNKQTSYICKILQTIDENQEYYDINFKSTTKSNPKTQNPNPTKNTYGLLYNFIYLKNIYKFINSFSCYKHKTCN